MEAIQASNKADTDIQIKNLMSEVLWRIKDAEELIKERVPEERVTNLINELKHELQSANQ